MAYPSTIDSFTTKQDNVTDVLASHVNDLQTAIVSLQTKVGVDASEVAASIDYKVAARKVFHGVQAAGALSFDNPTHVLSIASITYWYKGVKYVSAVPVTADIDTDNTLTANTLYFFYFEDATGTLKCSTTPFNLKEQVPIAMVLWNGSAGAVMKETHGYTRDLDWHINAHLTIGARYYGGLALTAPTTADDATLSITGGTIYDEDLANVIANPQTTMRGLYQASAGVYTFADYALPYLGASGDPVWLDTDDYTLKSVADSNFVNYWVYASNDIDRPIYIIPTQAADTYNTIALARAETPPALSGLNITPELKLIYRFTYRGDGQFQESVDYRNASVLPAGGVASTSASSVTFSPSGNISATSVQGAIEELDTEKEAITNKVTSLSGASTDVQYPSAKLVYDQLAGKQAALTFGIANTNAVKIDAADVALNDYAKFTANGLVGRSYSEVLSDIGAQAAGSYQAALNGTGFVKISGTTISYDNSTYLTSVTAHDLLSATHGDTTAAAVARGSIITGQGATPKWTALAIGSAGKALVSDGTDIGWSSSALGTGAYATIANYAPLANPTFTGVVTTPAVKITTGAGLGKVLTSDADGDAAWESPSGSLYVLSASTNIKYSALTERTVQNSTPQKVKEFQVNVKGSIKIYFEGKDPGGYSGNVINVCKNGGLVYQRNVDGVVNYTEYSYDMTGLVAGDLIQLYIGGSGSSITYVRNAKIGYDITNLSDAVVNQD